MQRTLRDVLQKGTSKEEFQKRLIARMAKRKKRGFFAFERTSKFLVERQPGYTKWIIDEADVAMRGEVILPGTGGKPMFVGNPPDWLTNPTGDSDVRNLAAGFMPPGGQFFHVAGVTGTDDFSLVMLIKMRRHTSPLTSNSRSSHRCCP